MKPLQYHPSAQVEIEAIHDWYFQRSPQAADGFYEALIPALNRVREHSRQYPSHLYGTQRYVLSRYPFSVIFRERMHDIQIVAVAHARRRPGYWAKRLKQ